MRARRAPATPGTAKSDGYVEIHLSSNKHILSTLSVVFTNSVQGMATRTVIERSMQTWGRRKVVRGPAFASALLGVHCEGLQIAGMLEESVKQIEDLALNEQLWWPMWRVRTVVTDCHEHELVQKLVQYHPRGRPPVTDVATS